MVLTFVNFSRKHLTRNYLKNTIRFLLSLLSLFVVDWLASLSYFSEIGLHTPTGLYNEPLQALGLFEYIFICMLEK